MKCSPQEPIDRYLQIDYRLMSDLTNSFSSSQVKRFITFWISFLFQNFDSKYILGGGGGGGGGVGTKVLNRQTDIQRERERER